MDKQNCKKGFNSGTKIRSYVFLWQGQYYVLVIISTKFGINIFNGVKQVLTKFIYITVIILKGSTNYIL